MLPRAMQVKEFCDICHKEMEINCSFLREDQSAVEVWYKCKCGHKIGFAYSGKFVEAYKQGKNYPGEQSSESGEHIEDSSELHGEKR